MEKVVKFLQENKSGYLATVEAGKPKVRPFQFMLEDGGKLYFCTSNAKAVYRQLKANPSFEFSTSSPNYTWIRLSGNVEFSSDLTIKEKVLKVSPLVKSIYQTADNPIFEIFYVEHGIATISDFSGKPPQVFEF
ncbi:pyridoxamine 5'-phosphate oxidase family protein [Propionispora hippei]|uniref:Uncharacterized protein, pyridoxamine 5'-phosphate oxidase (PNPOx-like) family n=1 Tax=Propionispora hippei DSM 15287 TaxID=1123003 RepID=A0A1M6NTZ6_9FIRM|nr:pyridoxamine 5'-phosphate oxidase family protein [Propionispora hippei]SHJ99196.1 Uncharacterized protein, pyridoxamine 5'-phosphate oxidase (PNPOx-like) family [Propionispora hippei DSM 15287]